MKMLKKMTKLDMIDGKHEVKEGKMMESKEMKKMMAQKMKKIKKLIKK